MSIPEVGRHLVAVDEISKIKLFAGRNCSKVFTFYKSPKISSATCKFSISFKVPKTFFFPCSSLQTSEYSVLSFKKIFLGLNLHTNGQHHIKKNFHRPGLPFYMEIPWIWQFRQKKLENLELKKFWKNLEFLTCSVVTFWFDTKNLSYK